MTQTNHHFWIGKHHKVNQDYCLSGEVNGWHYAIVCDGCSSSPDSDFGARILARAAVNNIELVESPEFKSAVISSARVQAKSLGLALEALDATLNLVVVKPDGKVITKCFGDGFTIFVGDNYIAYKYSFKSGAPLYLNYFLNNDRFSKYKDEFGLQWHQVRVETINNTTFVLNHSCLDFELYKETFFFGKQTLDPFLDLDDCTSFRPYHHSLPNIKAVLVCTDGFDSFYQTIITDTSKTNKKIPLQEVFDTLINFKSFNGAFVERRVNKFLEFCQKNNWHNSDDCSIAGISLWT